MKIYRLKNISALAETVASVWKLAKGKKIFCFYGELGSGKTTFIKEMCRQMKAKENASSPSFSLINEYTARNGKKIFHLDLYRMKNEEEIYDIGYEEYLFSGNYCFIEWAEKMEHLLPENCVRIKIQVNGKQRVVHCSG